jgi:ankyrin repeat protein
MKNLSAQPTKGHIKEVLQHMAKGIDTLDNTYEQVMGRIEDQEKPIREIANRILGWIVHAKRPLSTTELQHALAVRFRTEKLDTDYCPTAHVLQSVCAGLVTIDKESNIIRLVHYTTQQYLERTWTFWFSDAQTHIANVCVTYLSFNAFEIGICQSDEEFEARLQNNVLYSYAAENWGYHAYAASSFERSLVLDLLKSKTKVAAAGQALMDSKNFTDYCYSEEDPKGTTGVHIAAFFGLGWAITDLLRIRSDVENIDINSRDSYGWTPLLFAVENGHEAVVKLLLETGKVDVNLGDYLRQTPLWIAAWNGNEAVVKLLLETGVIYVNIEDIGYGQTPLWNAAESGHEAVVKLLLETGTVDADTRDNTGQTPLWIAAENGHEAVVKLLLETGKVDVNSKDTTYEQTPLWNVIMNGHEAVVKLLLETGKVDVNTKDRKYGRTPLSFAAKKGREAVVKLLLETGKVDVDIRDNTGQTPLWIAAENGHEAVVKLLLETGKVTVDVKDTSGRTPLWIAAENGHEVVVKLLLETGKVDADSRDTFGRTPLGIAAENGQEAVVKLLLETGKVDVNSKDTTYGQTPLWIAAEKGHEAVVKLLRSHV